MNFLSRIPVSDWLTFCYRNMILNQKKGKKRNKNYKNTNFLIKKTKQNKKKNPKSKNKHKVAFFTLNVPCDVTCSKL